MQRINEDIKKREFKKVYLLYGEEAYLIHQYKKRLIGAILPEGDSMNYTKFEGKEAQIPTIIDLAETMPFFAEYRVILVEDSGFCKNSSNDLADYLKQMPDSTCIIFSEKEVDKRNRLYKAIKEIGREVEFKKPDDRTITRWLLGIITKNQKKIAQATMQLFLERAGSSMENLEHELEKLICYVGDREIIELSDVETICTDQIENKIFEMIHKVAEKQQKQALQMYYDLLALKEPPMRILFLMVRQFNILLQIKTMLEDHKSQEEIAELTGVRSFAIRRYRSQAGHFSVKQLKKALEDFAEAEELVKTGRMEDRLCLETLLIKYSS